MSNLAEINIVNPLLETTVAVDESAKVFEGGELTDIRRGPALVLIHLVTEPDIAHPFVDVLDSARKIEIENPPKISQRQITDLCTTKESAVSLNVVHAGSTSSEGVCALVTDTTDEELVTRIIETTRFKNIRTADNFKKNLRAKIRIAEERHEQIHGPTNPNVLQAIEVVKDLLACEDLTLQALKSRLKSKGVFDEELRSSEYTTRAVSLMLSSGLIAIKPQSAIEIGDDETRIAKYTSIDRSNAEADNQAQRKFAKSSLEISSKTPDTTTFLSTALNLPEGVELSFGEIVTPFTNRVNSVHEENEFIEAFYTLVNLGYFITVGNRNSSTYVRTKLQPTKIDR